MILGFTGFGGSELRPLGSIVVAIILLLIAHTFLGVTNFIVFPIELANILKFVSVV